MIEIKGSYIFDLVIGNKTDFVTNENFKAFIITCELGLILPRFTCKFNLDKKQILKVLNEGNDIIITYGKSIKSAKKLKGRMLGSPQIEKSGNNNYDVIFSGLLDLPNFLNNRSFISDKVSAAEVLNERAKFLGLNLHPDNIKTSLDSQNWIQFGNSDRSFMLDTMLHMDLNNKSFPVIGITDDNTFRLFNVKKQIENNPKWNLVVKATNNYQDINYLGNATFLNENTSLINMGLGYNSNLPLFNLETGENTVVNETINNLLSINKKLPLYIKEEQRLDEQTAISTYVHKNYWKCYQYNLRSSFLYSKVQLLVKVVNQLKPIYPGDIVYFQDLELLNDILSDTTLSGNYIVNKTTLALEGNQTKLAIELSRENYNNAQGNF